MIETKVCLLSVDLMPSSFLLVSALMFIGFQQDTYEMEISVTSLIFIDVLAHLCI